MKTPKKRTKLICFSLLFYIVSMGGLLGIDALATHYGPKYEGIIVALLTPFLLSAAGWTAYKAINEFVNK